MGTPGWQSKYKDCYEPDPTMMMPGMNTTMMPGMNNTMMHTTVPPMDYDYNSADFDPATNTSSAEPTPTVCFRAAGAQSGGQFRLNEHADRIRLTANPEWLASHEERFNACDEDAMQDHKVQAKRKCVA